MERELAQGTRLAPASSPQRALLQTLCQVALTPPATLCHITVSLTTPWAFLYVVFLMECYLSHTALCPRYLEEDLVNNQYQQMLNESQVECFLLLTKDSKRTGTDIQQVLN